MGPAPAVNSLVTGVAAQSDAARAPALDPGLSSFAWVLLAYVATMAALATLCPFDFTRPAGLRYALWFSSSDVALNLCLLFPAGFLWRLARGARGHASGLDALALGLAFSALLELLQAFLPSRVTSPIDVLTNGLGAWAGAVAHARLSPWLDRRVHHQLSLHLPLANILYLLAPLCSLDALSMRSGQECFAALPLAAFTAWVAAALYKHRLLAGQKPFAWRLSCAIGALLGIGYAPVGMRFAFVPPLLFISGLCLTRAAIAAQSLLTDRERRFVVATIVRALPWFIGYLVLCGGRAWLSDATLADESAGPQVRAFGLLRDAAAFTLLGYLISELHARSALPTRYVLARAAGSGGLLGALSVMLSTYDSHAQAVEVALFLAAAAGIGAFIHRAQLRLVRSWGHSLRPASMRN